MSEPKINDQQIQVALVSYYTPPEPVAAAIGGSELEELLNRLPALSLEGQVGSLLNQIRQYHPGISLGRTDTATLRFIDDTVADFLTKTDLDYRVECILRALLPYYAVDVIQNGVSTSIQTSGQPILSLLDLLLSECVGWSEDLGILGDQYMEKIDEPIALLVKGRVTLEDCLAQLRGDFEKENRLSRKMEATLADKELAILEERKAKLRASKLLNREMADHKLPMFTIFLLQGAWHDFLQEIIVHYGEDSKEWQNAEKLTEALIWSLQPGKNKAKQYAVMESLPGHITDFSSKLKFDTSTIVNALADIQEEYEQIKRGEPSEPCEFDLLDQDDSLISGVDLDSDLLEQLSALSNGDWFLYDDKNEPEEKIARLRIIMNSASSERLLFTNHNRRKGMQLNYTQMAMQLRDGTIKPLSPIPMQELFKVHLNRVLQNVSDQNKKKKKLADEQEQLRLSQEYTRDRKTTQTEKQKKLLKILELKKKRSLALRRKAERKLKFAVEAVSQLRPDAWVKLPLMVGTLTPAKLVAIIPGNEKYIFANRAGIKVAEYTASQLSNMLVTENSEILDTGDEFENVLSSVVVGLRQNRSKSFAELTGDTS